LSFEEVYGSSGLDQDGVKIITAAPDVYGVVAAAGELRERGVTLSIGHR
jgi:N-acetylglucosamine-6-phosphate deacetylase